MPRSFFSTRGSQELPVTPKAFDIGLVSSLGSPRSFRFPKVFDRSLRIGIDYVGTRNELSGCRNDANNIYTLLTKRGVTLKNDTLMTDDTVRKPTRFNILQSLEMLVAGVVPGMNILFTYAGHGAYVKNSKDSYETDHRDETLVPLDCDSAGMIKDDEINKILCKLPQGVNMFILTDCCHSGTVTDLPYMVTVDTVSVPSSQHAQQPLPSLQPMPNQSMPTPQVLPSLFSPYNPIPPPSLQLPNPTTLFPLLFSPFKMNGKSSIHYHHSSHKKYGSSSFKNKYGKRVYTDETYTVYAPGIIDNIDVVFKDSILAQPDLFFYQNGEYKTLLDIAFLVYNTLQRPAVDRSEFDSVLVQHAIFYCVPSDRNSVRFYYPDPDSISGYSENRELYDTYSGARRFFIARDALIRDRDALNHARDHGHHVYFQSKYNSMDTPNNRYYSHLSGNDRFYRDETCNYPTGCNNTTFNNQENNQTIQETVIRSTSFRPPNCRANILAISGCDDSETSKEDSNANGSCGAMSNVFSILLEENAGKCIDIGNVLTSMRSRLKRFDQAPQICSSYPIDATYILDLTELQ